MTYDSFLHLINNGIPAEALGGISAAIIIDLFKRTKEFFNGSNPSPEEYNRLLTVVEFKEILDKLVEELIKIGINVNQADKIEIKNQLINPIFNKPVTFS